MGNSKQKQITHDNHYVPQFYLKQWSTNGHSLWCYDTVAEDRRVKIWKRSSIKSAACWRDLYTLTDGDGPTDDIERYFDKHVENIAKSIFEKIKDGRSLEHSEMEQLIHYLAAQLARTPHWFEYANELIRQMFPRIFEQEYTKLENKIKNEGPEKFHSQQAPKDNSNDPFPKIPIEANINSAESTITAEITLGNRSALASTGVIMNKDGLVYQALHRQQWVILESPVNLPTSDNPVVYFGKYENDRLSFDVGIGTNNVDIAFPLTPKHLLFTEVGQSREALINLENYPRFWNCIQEAIIKGAWRYIYAKEKIPNIEQIRPRTVIKGEAGM